jgi:hypothetical protein
MPESSNQVRRTLLLQKKLFGIVVAANVLIFLFVSYSQLRQLLQGGLSDPIWERYGIISTLIVIPSCLKLFHYLVERMKEKSYAAYTRIFILRLAILEAVLLLNMTGVLATGSRNFFYMALISLVAFFFCLPNKNEIDTLCEDRE